MAAVLYERMSAGRPDVVPCFHPTALIIAGPRLGWKGKSAEGAWSVRTRSLHLP